MAYCKNDHNSLQLLLWNRKAVYFPSLGQGLARSLGLWPTESRGSASGSFVDLSSRKPAVCPDGALEPWDGHAKSGLVSWIMRDCGLATASSQLTACVTASVRKCPELPSLQLARWLSAEHKQVQQGAAELMKTGQLSYKITEVATVFSHYVSGRLVRQHQKLTDMHNALICIRQGKTHGLWQGQAATWESAWKFPIP